MKNLYHSSLLFLAFISCQESRPAAPRIAQLGKGLHVGLPLAFAAYCTHQLFKRNLPREPRETFTNPTPGVEAWVREQIASCNDNNVTIRIYPSLKYAGLASTFPKILGLSPDVAEYLENNIDKTASDDRIATFSFLARHEMGHFHHKDTSDSAGPETALWGLGHLAVHSIGHRLSSFFFRKQIIPTSAKAKTLFLAGSLAYGVGKYALGDLLGTQLTYAYKRHIEARADQFACDHTTSPQLLRGAANGMERMSTSVLFSALPKKYTADGELDSQAMVDTFAKLHPMQRRFICRFAYWKEDPIHPDPLDRACRLRKAADKLEQEEAQQPVVNG